MNEETNTSLLNIDEYFINQKVSDYNSKTGIFEGYNYINILVESFDYLAIDKVLTPTIYKFYEEWQLYTGKDKSVLYDRAINLIDNWESNSGLQHCYVPANE